MAAFFLLASEEKYYNTQEQCEGTGNVTSNDY